MKISSVSDLLCNLSAQQVGKIIGNKNVTDVKNLGEGFYSYNLVRELDNGEFVITEETIFIISGCDKSIEVYHMSGNEPYRLRLSLLINMDNRNGQHWPN